MSKRACPVGPKRHYLPVFYLRRWAGRDGRLCEYSRPWDRVKPRMTHPDGTGYEHNLHSEPVEQWLKLVDQRAFDVMDMLLDGRDISALDLDQRSAWSRFVMSLVRRNPEKVASIGRVIDTHVEGRLANLEAGYLTIRGPTDPPTFEEYKTRRAPVIRDMIKAETLTTIIDSPVVGGAINQMVWGVATLLHFRPCFLTSDRPIVMTNGLGYPTAHIVLPISSRAIFIATNTSLNLEHLKTALSDGSLIDHVYHIVVAQAQKYVYFVDDSRLSYVEGQLGISRPSFIGDQQNLRSV
jgi:uncharacterized protein DUF4238